MNTQPHYGGQQIVNEDVDAPVVQDRNREGAFWQSRATVAGQQSDPIDVTDINELARRIRSDYARVS